MAPGNNETKTPNNESSTEIIGLKSLRQHAKKEVLCDGWFYDVTDFARKHPGGSIIDYYTKSGEDASLAMQQFHHRSAKKVSIVLKSLKRRLASDKEVFSSDEQAKRHKALTEDFTKLYIELEKEGMFKPSYTQTAYRIVELITLAYVGYRLLSFQNYLVKFLGCILLGLAQGRSGWVQHEGGHNSITGNPKVDKIIQDIIIGIGLGNSSTWWRRVHNRHHAMPQRLKHDTDLNTLPFLAHHAQVVEDPKQGKGFLLQNQKHLFILIDTLLINLFWQFYLAPVFVITKGLWFQAINIFLHHFFFGYVCGFWPWLISGWFQSIYLILNFALSHTHLPITKEPTHWVEYALLHTTNVEPKPWCDWWMGYLNYQVEHHLFPTMPQFRNPLVSPRVKALAEKHGIPYHVYSYREVVAKTFNNLGNVSMELMIG